MTTFAHTAKPALKIADAAMSIRVMRAACPSTPGEERLDIEARRSIVTSLRTFRKLRADLGLMPTIRLP
jgi:hypothetical protein